LSNDKHRKELEFIISEINNSWLKNDLKNLNGYFHDDMIIVDSNFNKLASNKKECIASYKSFINQAKILNYKEYEININIAGNTAIINYIFDITWEVNGLTSSEKGRDVFVFEKLNNKWLAVWRTILPVF